MTKDIFCLLVRFNGRDLDMFKDREEEVSRRVLTSWEKKKIIALLDF